MCNIKCKCSCDVLTDSSNTVQSGVTPDVERSLAGLSLSSNRAATQFDFPESLTEEHADEITADVEAVVYFIVLVVFRQKHL